jgi:hypothetical protein
MVKLNIKDLIYSLIKPTLQISSRIKRPFFQPGLISFLTIMSHRRGIGNNSLLSVMSMSMGRFF